MNKSYFLRLIVLVFLLTSLWPLLPAQADTPFPSPDVDGDGLSNELEIGGWYNLSGGPFFTDPYNADSDSDGLTDGEEKLFDTNPLDPANPGIYIRYEDRFKTRQYFSPRNDMEKDEWGNWIRKYLPVRQGGDRLLMTEAMVVRRGTTFHIGGPLTATLSISSNGLTAITPVKDECQNTWSVTIPANARTGTYTATLGSKSMPIYAIFELPTDLTQAQIDAYIYDDDPLNKRDEVSVWWRTPEWSYYFPGYSETTPPNCDNYPTSACSNWKYGLATGYAQAFWTEQFTQKVFVKHAMVAIQGQNDRTAAANKIIDRADQEFRTVYINTHNTWSTAMRKFHDGTGWTMNGGACQDNANVLTSLLRSAGLPAKPFIVDWNKTPGHGEGGQIGNLYEYDHSVLLWLGGSWKRARSYNGQELDDVYYPYYNGRIYVTSSLYNVYQDYAGDLIVSSDHRWDWQNGSNGGGMVNTVWLTDGQQEGVPTEEFKYPNNNWDYQWWSHRPLAITRSPYVVILNYEAWNGDGWAPGEWRTNTITDQNRCQVNNAPYEHCSNPNGTIVDVIPPGRLVTQTYVLPSGVPDPVNPLENWPYNPVPIGCSPSSAGTQDCLDMLSGMGGMMALQTVPTESMPADKGTYQIFLPLVMSGARTAPTTPVKLGRILNSYGQDTDGNGRFDRLVVEVEVNAAQTGQYKFGGTLLVGDRPVSAQSGPVTVRPFDPQSDTQTVQLVFDGETIGRMQIDGPYSLVELWAAYPDQPIEKVIVPSTMLDHHYLNYQTPAFRAADLETVAALFNNRFSHRWLDVDGDGRYEALDIDIGININYPGVYTVTGELDDGEGHMLGMATWSGTDSTATLRFDVAKTVAPYTLGRLYLYDAHGRILSSRFYQAYQIQQAPALLDRGTISFQTFAGSDRGLFALAVSPTSVFTTTTTDADGDGRYDALVIQAGVFVSGTTGSYRIEGLLVDEQGTPVVWSVSDPKPLDLGDQTLELTFDGKALYDYLSFGPSMRTFRLVAVKIFSGNLSPATLEAQVDVALTTSSYQRDNFEPSGIDLLVDDMESGSNNWIWTSPWSRLNTAASKSPTYAWRAQTSSTTNGTLRTVSLDTRNYVHPALRFQTCYNLPNANKTGYVEVSSDGVNWNTVQSFSNSNRPWTFNYVDLDNYGGQENVQVRFRANSTSGTNQMTWYIDNVYLTAWPAVTEASFTYAGGPLGGCTPIAFTATYTSVDTTLPITYTWSWGDGSTTVTAEPIVIHEFPDVGEYTVVLTVENPYDSAVATDTVTITIPCGPYFTSTPIMTATEEQPYVYNITVDATAGGPLTVTAPTLPAWLTLVDHGNRTATLSGTPDNAQVGPHAVLLQVQDSLGLLGTQAFTLTVENVNDPPTLNDATFTVDENGAVGTPVGTVTATDIDAGDTLTYSILSGNIGAAFAIGAANGAITVNNSVALDYETMPQFVLTVQVIDSGNLTDTAVVTVNLRDVNDAPVLAAIGNRTVDEGTLLSFTATATDADLPPNTLTFSLGADAPAGTSINPTTGEFTWTPTEAQGPGVYTVTVIVTDNGSPNLSDGETFTITVNEVNEPPVAGNDQYTVDEGNTLVITAPGVLGNDTDSEGSPLTAILVGGVSHGTLVFDSSGAFTYTHNGSETLLDSFTYRAGDGELESNIATVTIIINPVNDPPVAVDDGYTTLEGGILTVIAPGVLGNDIDPERGTLISTLIRQPTHGVVTLNANGAFTYLHDGSETTVDDFEYRVCDDGDPALCDIATVTIAIIPVNDAPVANNDEYTVDEGGTLIIAAPGVLGNDTDAEGNPLQAVLVTGPTHGILILNSDGSFTYTHDGSETTVDNLTYRAGDGLLASNIATVTLNINPINDPPVANDDRVVTPENTPVMIDVLTNDTDPEGDTLTIIALSSPANGTVTHDGVRITYTPNAGFDGEDTFTYTVSDGHGGTAQATVTVTVDDSLAVLNIYVIGQGNVERNPATTWYARGSDVLLTAHADPGWVLDGWSGDLSGTANPATLTMAGNRTVTATFVYTGFHPQIDVHVDAADEAAVGETVIYTITLSHAPDSDGWPVNSIQVNNSIGEAAVYIGGDTDGDGELDADETWIWVVEYIVQEADPNPLLNTITVSARDLEGDTVQFESTHSTAIVVRGPTRFTVYLPLVSRNFAAPAATTDGPDLIVQQVRVTGNSVQVVIKNQGNRPVVDSFWVDLYINPTTAPTRVNQAWNDLGTQGMVWGVMPTTGMLDLGPGQTVTLVYGGPYYWASKSQVSWPLPAGASIYVQVDSYSQTTSFGGVLENHEMDGKPYNNIATATVSVTEFESEPQSLEEIGPMFEGDLPPR